MPAPKGSSREAQRRLCAGQISHVSLLQQTDRSSQYSLLNEGQVHARHAEREQEGGRESKSEKEVRAQTTSFLSLFTLSPCIMSPMSFRLSLPLYTPLFLSLSPQRNPVSPLGLELFEGDPKLYCSLPLLSSLPSPTPTPLPSTPTPHPLGGLDPAQLRAAMLQIQAGA